MHPGLFINNTWKTARGPSFQSLNPATGDVIWEGTNCTLEDVDQAVKSAQQAFKKWSLLSLNERSYYLQAFKSIVINRQDELAEAISKENGKTLWDSKNEVQSIIGKVTLSIEAYGERCPGIMRDLPSTAKLITKHRPHGVVGIFGPFNFPGHTPSGHIIPALLAGNTIVFKPSEQTPLIGEMLANYWTEAGLPEGVFNVVQGDKETGHSLLQHPDIQGIFFTGSYDTGRLFAKYFGEHPEKILALELGGNNPLIITDINDIEAAAYLTIQSAYLSAGQRCTCARRLLVVKNPKNEAFIDQLKEIIRSIVVGKYSDHPQPFMGPVISEKQALALLEAQVHLKTQGGQPLIEMKHLKAGTGFLSPGLIDSTSIKQRLDEEYFGPLLQLFWVKDLEEAVIQANQTKYGLTAGLFSEHREDYDYFYSSIRAGIVNWNTPNTNASGAAPFGGIKASGNHRPSGYYAADYCAYPVASMEASHLVLPVEITPGIRIQQKA